MKQLNLDKRVVAFLFIAYIVVASWHLPISELPRMLGGALAMAGVVAAVAHTWLKRASVHPFSIMAVAFVSAAVLVMPSFPAMGGRHPDAVWIGFLGTQALVLLWVALCWEPGLPRPKASFASVLQFALGGALVVSLVAAIPIGLATLNDKETGTTLSLVFPAYFLGALLAGICYWLLQPIRHHPTARYLIGCVAGFWVYAAMGPVVSITDGGPIRLWEIVTTGVVCGCLVGPPVAFSWGETWGEIAS